MASLNEVNVKSKNSSLVSSTVTGPKRTGRLEQRLKTALNGGNYYEAHQSLKVLYDRYISQGKIKEGWSLLLKGAEQLLSKNQWESGTEIALLLVNHLKDRKVPATSEIMNALENLFKSYKYEKCDDPIPHPLLPSLRLFPSIANLSKEEAATLHTMQINRDMYMKAVIKWTSLVNEEFKYGDVKFHQLLAVTCFEEGELEKARKHFLYADMPIEFGQLLVELSEKYGSPAEVDMFITQAVLQLLVLGKKENAFKTFNHYCYHHSLIKPFIPPPFPYSPLLNFSWFLLHSIDIGNLEVFDCLCESYSHVLSWDPTYFSYLNKVGQLYFNSFTQAMPPQGPGGLMSLFTGGGETPFNSLFGLEENDSMLLPQSLQETSKPLDMCLFNETAEGLD